MQCLKCQQQNPDTAQFCARCGASLAVDNAPSLAMAPPPPRIFATPQEIALPNTSGLAITALVLGIAAILTLGVFSLPALIVSIIAIVQVRRGGALKGSGMAIGGLVCSLLALFLASPVIARLPIFSEPSEKAKLEYCMIRQKHLTTGIMMYLQDHEEVLPGSLDDIRGTYVPDPKVYVCPSAKGGAGLAYNGNMRKMPLGNIHNHSETIITADSNSPDGLFTSIDQIDATRHGKQFIAGFIDGHVAKISDPSTIRFDIE